MPNAKYHQAQADLAARLAAAASDPQIADGYSRLALEQLEKAANADPSVRRAEGKASVESCGVSDVGRERR
jgi:hypothetical protein